MNRVCKNTPQNIFTVDIVFTVIFIFGYETYVIHRIDVIMEILKNGKKRYIIIVISTFIRECGLCLI